MKPVFKYALTNCLFTCFCKELLIALQGKLSFRKALLILLLFTSSLFVNGQCTNASLNWDYLDYFTTSDISLANCQSQKFAIGANKVTITHNFTSSNFAGENATHTGETGAYGTGEDIHFTGDGTITFTFQSSVTNVKFSLFDIDYNQKATVTAKNGATSVNVTMAKVSGTNLTIAGSGTTSASATAGATTAVDVTSSDGTANVDIAGPITEFTITISQTGTKTTGPASGRESGEFWVSDVTACVTSSFPSSYYSIAAPRFTGQPGYILAVRNDSVYAVNTANGKAKYVFADLGHTNLNSVAYDPYNYMVYYVYSLTASSSSVKQLRRYDYNMDTMGIVVSDVNNIGVYTFTKGLESGAAAYYDGSLYLGVESASPNEHTVWKINFTGLTPTSATQVYSMPPSNHDWGDISVSNGVLYDFDQASGASDFFHYNLASNAITTYTPTGGVVARQSAVGYNGQVYNVGGDGTSASGSIAAYNYDATLGTSSTIINSANNVTETGSWGDATEAFTPKTDYGDAPATYDPAGSDPATHEKISTLRLGASEDIEWSKTSSSNATGDGSDEDGITGTLTVGSGTSSFSFNVSVLNNTGFDATLAGWIDLNNDGVFQSSEGVTTTVSTSSSTQTKTIGWTSVNVSASVGSTIFLRIRLTTSSMSTSNPTGYFGDGEVEDYPVTVSTTLATSALNLNVAKIAGDKAKVEWASTNENNIQTYEVQHSADGINWTTLYFVAASGNNLKNSYTDVSVNKPYTWYRIKINTKGSMVYYSDVKKLEFRQLQSIAVAPNPVKNIAQITVDAVAKGQVLLQVTDMNGRTVYSQSRLLDKGINYIKLPVSNWQNGMYHIRLNANSEIVTSTIIVSK